MVMTVKRLTDGSEKWTSKTVCASAEIKYYVINPTSKSAAIEAVFDAAPEKDGTLLFSSVRFDGYDGDGNIELTAEYEALSSGGGGGGDDDEEPTESFECGGGTKHVNVAIKQRRVYGGSNDDANGLIGWNGKSGSECEVAGVDLPAASPRQTYTKVMRVSKVTDTAYKRRVSGLVSKVNSKPFKGWEAGELMFENLSYSTPASGQTHVTVTFHFKVSLNESDAKVAGKSIGKKEGHEYVWTRHKTVKDDTSGAPKTEVDSIYVSTVCEAADFSVLGL